MHSPNYQRPLWKRVTFALCAAGAFILLFFIATQFAARQIFMGIASSRATGLAATWDNSDYQASRDLISFGSVWISRSAALRMRTDSFDHSLAVLRVIVANHKGSFEDFKTEAQSGSSRTLVATLTVPASELDAALSEIRGIGRVERISEASEDSAIKLASLQRRAAAAKENLDRLQNLQVKKASVRDSIALQKEISEAKEKALETEKERVSVLSTVSQAFVRLNLLEEYRAGFDFSIVAASLQLRNAFLEGLTGIISSTSILISGLLQYGLPLVFWSALLFYPVRLIWRKVRNARTAPQVA